MSRRAFIAGLAVSLAAPLESRAQPPKKPQRIGVLLGGAPVPPHTGYVAALRQGLRDLGYTEDTLVLETRWADGRYERLPELARQLASAPVDVLVAHGVPSSLAAKRATATIPIVIVGVADAIKTGLVPSLSRPGGNITGNTLLAAELSVKRLELLREAIPSASRVALLWNPDNAANAVQHEELRLAAPALGIRLIALEAASADQLDAALSRLEQERPDALMVLGERVHQLRITDIIAFAARTRLPAMYQLRENVEAGGLMSYGVSLADLFRRAAVHVDRILRGARPGDLPVEQPTRFELVVNVRTARALGLAIPPSVLLRADHLIE
jgi:putative ABC transport system substrate-binding protein